VFPYLKGNAVHVVALANQQCGSNGAINSAAHTEKNGRSGHGAVLYREEWVKG